MATLTIQFHSTFENFNFPAQTHFQWLLDGFILSDFKYCGIRQELGKAKPHSVAGGVIRIESPRRITKINRVGF